MYTAEISRKHPACLLLLIDQSYSMGETWPDVGGSKAEYLALIVNRVLGSASLLCSKGDDRFHDYFDVGVIGYGGTVDSLLHGADFDRPLLPISEVANNPRRIDQILKKIPDGAGGVVEQTISSPVWIDPETNGATPMVAALAAAESVVTQWCAAHPASLPPIVINLTDGVSTDGDPAEAAARLRTVMTDDGPVLLFNVHISALSNHQVLFPDSAAGLPDRYAVKLFDMSSVLPAGMKDAAASFGYSIAPESRGFLYNAQAAVVTEFLDIGTRAATPTGLRELTDGTSAAG
ncbi:MULTISPECIES: vWA domain-containing protein [Actinoalloteichus]|uniref:VWFA domain-containing protein n=1 Tax=Actinoalloteichus fjordicus TaxID=1612552 RepID=A0AAC9PTI0_9PSEU|nr:MULTISPECIES: vWA domain-containing protein [Actinoalloteichus]APU16699.1 hypothetical protein UA74_23405 [Actinoalloteichus fjordicus]APU22765.1 hypothetical protein UA75_23915 [Actinoalloteichus sp. GBA129-24]